ncbi:tRNA(Met) cytidine acetyltransferase TmcA [Halomonas sp.]|uniref:tRNA(Met) cytidine acetyltransferase TmcA n=1 Tax=Halomonas sp. TaxID=1486246 RepID=UPI00356854E3
MSLHRIGKGLDALADHRRHLAERRWRGLVWLAGDVSSCLERAEAIWHRMSWQLPLWVSSCRPESIPAEAWLMPSSARTRLGGESDLLIIDAVSGGSGFDPDAFGALSGTLRAGGLLVLMTPPAWGTRPDPDYVRLAAHPWQIEQLSAHYLARLAGLLQASSRVIHWPEDGDLRLSGCYPDTPPVADIRHPEDADCLTLDQARAVARLVGLRRRRPLVITADRGRGKTAALGIACARLLAAGEMDILVTAPRAVAVAPLFERLLALCPRGRRVGNEVLLEGRRVSFIAPDELSAGVREGQLGGNGSWLLVDEAAAIPAALLGEWLTAFPRIAFATTVHGYEGSGRGFALRFRERLERQTPNWEPCHLGEPIRWASGDPLEALVTRLLLLDAEPGEAMAPGVPVEYQTRRPADLIHDETRLQEMFGLLVQAHYRTTPADLRRLLDAPGIELSSLDAGGTLQAVLATLEEGGFDADLAEEVARGERRPRGHLMAQSLAAHAGSREALEGRLRRVLRIAVHPGRRREGLGRHLIELAREQARRDGCQLLGASLGAEPGLLAFWQAQGWRAVRLGLTRETATGEHAVMMVLPLDDRGAALASALQARLHRQLPGLLAFELADFDPLVVLALLAEFPPMRILDDDIRDIADVAFGHRAPGLARPAIQAQVIHAAAFPAWRQDRDLAVLAAWAFQGWDTAGLSRRLGVPGKRQAMAWLRTFLGRLHVSGVGLLTAHDGE